MAELLHDVLTGAADELDIPPAPVGEIVSAGRVARRRQRTPVIAGLAAAAVAAVVIPSLLLQGTPPSPAPTGPVVSQARTATLSGDKALKANRAYAHGGAFSVGGTVYFGKHARYSVDLGDVAVRGIYDTSAGALVRHGSDYVMDGSSPDSYSLVSPDGSVTQLNLRLGDVALSTDPTQPYLAYAMPGDAEWQVIVFDLRSGERAATVTVPGDFTWGGWDAPPVALSGDLVYVGLDDATVAVDWRTGEVKPTAVRGNRYPEIRAGRSLETTAFANVQDAQTGEVLLSQSFTGDRWASLSPDGKHMLLLPYLMIGDDDRIGLTKGAVLFSVDTGESMPIPASPVGGYGWTPDGLVFSVTEDVMTVCDGDAFKCTTSPLDLTQGEDGLGVLTLGGIVNEV